MNKYRKLKICTMKMNSNYRKMLLNLFMIHKIRIKKIKNKILKNKQHKQH